MAIIKKKCWPEIFELIKSNKKKFDLRVNDFDIQEGDRLILEEYNPETKEYTGRTIEKEIDYVLDFDLNKFDQEKEIKAKGVKVIQFKN